MKRRFNISIAIAILIIAFTGCDKAGTKAAVSSDKGEPLSFDNSRGAIQAVLLFDPGTVDYKRDVIMSLKITAPSSISVTMPELSDRMKGFIISGQYDKEPVHDGGKTIQERTVKLTPLLSDEHRIAPMPIVYRGQGGPTVESGWFATRPVILSLAPVNEGKVPDDIIAAFKPIWIFPGLKTIIIGLVLIAAAAGVIYLLILLVKRINRKIKIMRMSPKERALLELAELLSKDMIAKHLVKEFYVELTMIVRRYIERSHKVRAPEQTTEEFLAAVSNDVRFNKQVIDKLKSFLEAADLVKFAAYLPSDSAINNSTVTAKEYIETDYQEVEWIKEQERLEKTGRKAGS